MTFKNIFAQKSTYIDSYNSDYNYGRERTLSIFSSASQAFNQRMLIKFPDSLTAQNFQTANLVLSNVQHKLGSSDVVTMIINPLTRDWSQGLKYGDVDQRNYINRQAGISWSNSGGDYNTSISSVITLPQVYSDLIIDFTPFINYWQTNPNYGIIIRYQDESITSGQQNLYRRYNSVHTDFKLYRPKVMTSYSANGIYDNSNFMIPNYPYTIYLKNYVNGQLIDINSTSNPYSVSIVGLSAGNQQIIDTPSANRFGAGIYSATSSILPTNVLIYDSISAKWSNTASSYYPVIYKKLNLISPTRSENDYPEQIMFILSNKKQFYKKNQKILLKPILFKYKNIRQLVGRGSDIIICNSMYFKLVDYSTDKVIVDWFPVQYDQKQNFLFIDLNNIFQQDDCMKYSFIIQIKAQNVYGQTFVYGQSIFDNRLISII